ncbi:MAG TPA: RDD family protein, partial [Nocardioidaceae bacterium]|nr:RDD family protein [Nocardioidaceae bacterium]
MSDPTQNPPEGNDRPPTEPSSTPPPPPPGAQGAYGTGSAPPPPPPPGDWQQPGQMPPSYQPMTGGPGQPAELWPRFAARLIDYVLLTVVNVLLGGVLVAGMLMGADTSGSLGSIGVTSGTNWAVNAVTSLISAAIALGYFTLMEHNRGQTVGKMLLNLETRGPDGGRPTMEQALKRNAFTAIGVLGIIPFLG